MGGSIPPEAIWSGSSVESSGSNDPEGEDSTSSRTATIKTSSVDSSPTVRQERLYAITRADLSAGLRAAQVGHALIAWVLKHGEHGENLVVLQVPSRFALEELEKRLAGRVEAFHEPDLGGQLTAIAAGPECWREVSSIGLMR